MEFKADKREELFPACATVVVVVFLELRFVMVVTIWSMKIMVIWELGIVGGGGGDPAEVDDSGCC